MMHIQKPPVHGNDQPLDFDSLGVLDRLKRLLSADKRRFAFIQKDIPGCIE